MKMVKVFIEKDAIRVESGDGSTAVRIATGDKIVRVVNADFEIIDNLYQGRSV